MVKRNGKKIAAVAIAGALIMQNMATISAYEKNLENGEITELQLLTFNDLHGQIDETKYGGGIANLAGALKDLQKEAKENNKHVLTMSAGDQVGGSPAISALLQDQPTLEMMEEMNVDIVTTGNHEYDEGIKELERLIIGGTHSSGLTWNGTSYDWITANVIAKKDMTFANRNVKAGEPIMEPYTVREVDGVKVGIIGIVTKDTAGKVVPDGIKDIEFTDEADAINKYTEELKAQGIKTIIVL